MEEVSSRGDGVFRYPRGSRAYYVLRCGCKDHTFYRHPLGPGRSDWEDHFKGIHGREFESFDEVMRSYGFRGM